MVEAPCLWTQQTHTLRTRRRRGTGETDHALRSAAWPPGT